MTALRLNLSTFRLQMFTLSDQCMVISDPFYIVYCLFTYHSFTHLFIYHPIVLFLFILFFFIFIIILLMVQLRLYDAGLWVQLYSIILVAGISLSGVFLEPKDSFTASLFFGMSCRFSSLSYPNYSSYEWDI